MKKLSVIIFLILNSFTMLVMGQNYHQDPSNSYRVVALSHSDEQIKSVSNEIEILIPTRIYLPTAFTPNGDGLNDTFGAIGDGIENYRLVIFNRWGEVLFSSNNTSQKWDGKFQGKPVPFGTYRYDLIASGEGIGKLQKSGQVTLIN